MGNKCIIPSGEIKFMMDIYRIKCMETSIKHSLILITKYILGRILHNKIKDIIKITTKNYEIMLNYLAAISPRQCGH